MTEVHFEQRPGETYIPNIGEPDTTVSALLISSSFPDGPGLSQEFLGRVSRFARLAQGWDGQHAEPIPIEVVNRTTALALASLQYLAEPFVAPADGSLLLRWRLPDDRAVELFMDSEELEALALIENDEVREIPVRTEEDVLEFLGELVGIATVPA